MKKDSFITKIIEAILALAMLAIIVVVSIQVLGRTALLARAPHWTEELSRIIFIFIVSVGAIIGIARNEFVSVDILTSKLKGKKAMIFNIILDFSLAGFFLILIPTCIKFIKIGAMQLSPSLRINMGFTYGFICISIFGMCVVKVYRSINGIIKLKKCHDSGEVQGNE